MEQSRISIKVISGFFAGTGRLLIVYRTRKSSSTQRRHQTSDRVWLEQWADFLDSLTSRLCTAKNIALRNFRATLSQSVRALLDVSFVPTLESSLPVDRTDYLPGPYMDAMLRSKICLAYGGDFYTPIASNPWFEKSDPTLADMHRFERIDVPAFIQRWDSFRLWESFASGCLTVHLDFEKYGFALPIMPEAWEHYAPIDLNNIEDSVTEILDREGEWSDIAEQGRDWAIAHYAPKATASRVFSEMIAHAGNSQ